MKCEEITPKSFVRTSYGVYISQLIRFARVSSHDDDFNTRNKVLIIDRRISFYSQNTNMLPRKPKISYRYLKSGIEEFHRKYVLVPADKAANNVVVV